MYYNTTNKEGYELYGSVKRAKSQTELILDFFKSQAAGCMYAPHEVLDAIWPLDLSPGAPKRPLITSVRRALSTLTKNNELEKTSIKVMGPEGEPVHCWKLKTKP